MFLWIWIGMSLIGLVVMVDGCSVLLSLWGVLCYLLGVVTGFVWCRLKFKRELGLNDG